MLRQGRQEPAGFVAEQRVDAESLLARKMIVNRLVGKRNALPSFFLDSLPILEAGGVVGLQVALGNGRVGVPAVGTLPTGCIDVIAATE